MTTQSTTQVARRSRLDRGTAMQLARIEYERCTHLLQSLSAEEWAAPTVCAPWDVRQMAAHMLGMVEYAASIREQRRQVKVATQTGPYDVDRQNDLHVTERADWAGPRIAERWARRCSAAMRGRRFTPWFVRRISVDIPQVNGRPEQWTVGFLVDVIATRDPWMHRQDICEALGRTPELTADHDGVLVNDVVDEWLERHGQDVHLTLTGPAGGTWTVGTTGPSIVVDAVDFCRGVSGRPSTTAGLPMGTEVPF